MLIKIDLAEDFHHVFVQADMDSAGLILCEAVRRSIKILSAIFLRLL